MPDFKNHTGTAIILPSGHVLRGDKPTSLPADVMEHADNRTVLAPLFLRGEVSEVAPEPAPITREDIAKARRTDLLDILAAHGVTEGDVEGVKLADLRELALRVVFVGL